MCLLCLFIYDLCMFSWIHLKSLLLTIVCFTIVYPGEIREYLCTSVELHRHMRPATVWSPSFMPAPNDSDRIHAYQLTSTVSNGLLWLEWNMV